MPRATTLLALASLALVACEGARGRGSSGGGTVFRPGNQPDATVVADAGAVEDDGGPSLDAGEVGEDAAVGPGDAAATPDAGAPPPTGAFLYIGAAGGGPGSDLYPAEVQATLQQASVPVALDVALPGDLPDRYGLLVLLNPQENLTTDVIDAARGLLARGGRVLIVMEHCKNGCWGNATGNSDFIAALGGSITMYGEGGAPLSDTSLDLAEVPGITDGISDLVVYYSGSVDPGQGVALGVVPEGDPVIAYEQVGGGEIIAVADSSMFGFVLDQGDNQAFIVKLATF